MIRVERFFIEFVMEVRAEIIGQASTRRKAAVNSSDLIRLKLFNPTGIVNRLCHDLAGRTVALEFNQYQTTVRRDGYNINTTTKRSIFLSPDKHPLIG